MIRHELDYTQTPAIRPSTFSYAPSGEASPVVSVITPFYNESAVFHETFEAIFRQSWQDFEWILVDDHSTDDESVRMLREVAARDARISVIRHEENHGPAHARNTAMAQARGQYFLLLDSDDLIEPTALEKMVWKMHMSPDLMLCGGYTVGFAAKQYYWTNGFHSGAVNLNDNQICLSGVLLNKKLLERGLHFPTENMRGLEDWFFWLACAEAGFWGETLPEATGWYRRRETHGDRWKEWSPEGVAAFKASLPEHFPTLFSGSPFPQVPSWPGYQHGELPEELPALNLLRKDKPRLLMIVPWLVTGGADQFNLNMIKELKKRGWEVTIVTTVLATQQEWVSAFHELTSDIFILQSFLSPINYPRFIRYLIGSRDHDVIMVSNSEYGGRLSPYLRSSFPGKAIVNYTHMEDDIWQNGGHPRIALTWRHCFHSLQVASRHLKDWMLARGGEEGQVDVCYINVDSELWKPDAAIRGAFRRERGIPEDLPVIIFAGRVCAQKQPRVLIKTLHLLEQKGLNVCALIIGDGEDLPGIQAYAEEHRLRNVHFMGRQANDEVRRMMQAGDIYFLPSQMEGIALSIYEAMSCGLAILGADVGGQKELVTPETGRLLPRSTPDEEAGAYAGVLAEWLLAPDALASMRERARHRIVTSFSLEQMGRHMDSLLREAVRKAHMHELEPISKNVGDLFALQAIEWYQREHYCRQLYQQLIAKENS
jgi:glycosyltransferase involved in cell wall biosynthesis